MNIADRISDLRTRSPEQWLVLANAYLPKAVAVVLAIAIAWQLAAMTAALLPGEPPDQPVPLVTRGPSQGATAAPADLEVLRATHLFGIAPERSAEEEFVPVVDVVDAPETTLNLELTGVVFADVNELSMAIITSGRNEEKLYGIDDTIENASGATLYRVHRDRVILNRGGRLETLRLPREEAAATRPAARAARRQGSNSSTATAPLRQVISDNASRLTDIIRLAPHVENGQVVGFRVNPGREEEIFTALGLQAGDVVTDINGLALNDPSRGLQAFEALGESTMANVTVLRNGSPEVLVIDTSQLESLSQDRQ
jgi:general secretion pathway protein C